MADGRALGVVAGLVRGAFLVDRCERNGLVARSGDDGDSRLVKVALTAAGDELVGEFYADTCRQVEELAVGLGGDELEQLAGLLGRIVEEVS